MNIKKNRYTCLTCGKIISIKKMNVLLKDCDINWTACPHCGHTTIIDKENMSLSQLPNNGRITIQTGLPICKSEKSIRYIPYN